MNNKRILIIDDDPHIRELLAINIAAAGFTIATAENGCAGLSAVRREKPDLIVLDIMMPGMDGYEVCKIIRDSADLQSTKILMLTAKDAARDKMIGKEILRADEYLTKPFDIAELMAVIGALLGVPAP
jgi:two-component system, OmpR family, alkaline phosphatase synthesis response regulator PhoP